MKIKTSELIGAALDWAVAKCEDPAWTGPLTDDERYSTNWEHGGPVIEREKIRLSWSSSGRGYWLAHVPGAANDGSTFLIAAMRCYVASKLGDEVDVLDELGEINHA
jgi:hypothetical protein